MLTGEGIHALVRTPVEQIVLISLEAASDPVN